ncbi:MAG: hypothetical protein MZV70_35215 [Desulfobacterales bacterium]|nr:hypothetical protein [Desulfobacterales bacterium]
MPMLIIDDAQAGDDAGRGGAQPPGPAAARGRAAGSRPRASGSSSPGGSAGWPSSPGRRRSGAGESGRCRRAGRHR